MATSKTKSFARPAKKRKPKNAVPETPDDFQDAADIEEAAGGKHRVGDPVKSGRAFVRALEVYDNGLQRHPRSFDLAYNKARLQLEISQQQPLLQHIGVPLLNWLHVTLQSHQYALRLNEENQDVLFNTAQVLTSLAEHFSEADQSGKAVQALQEALELLSSCLSRQEYLMEQHRQDFPDVEEGGVSIDDDSAPVVSSSDDADADVAEQSVTIESPVTPSDLLDTVHASLSALTTLVALSTPTAIQALSGMVQGLADRTAPAYVALLPPEAQDEARFSVHLARATFLAAFGNVQFEAALISLQDYLASLDVFEIPGKAVSIAGLTAEADARQELVLSTVHRDGDSADLQATLCWAQMTLVQDLLAKAVKLTSEEAQERRAETYRARGDAELLRYRLATMPRTDLSQGVRRSDKTLVGNAATYYKGAAHQAKADGDDELSATAEQRWALAKAIAATLHGVTAQAEIANGPAAEQGALLALEECVDEGLASPELPELLRRGSMATSS